MPNKQTNDTIKLPRTLIERGAERVSITCNAYGKIRTEELQGHRYVVVPVVLITSGVFRGNHGDLEYTANELGRWPQGWNNKPILNGHPTTNAGAGSAEVLSAQQLGILLNSGYDDPKLKSEAWLREDLITPELKQKLETKEPISVSTGLFHDVEVTTNSTGETISRKVVNIVPDHLAVLLNEAPACSITSGAGLLMNSKGSTNNSLTAGDTRDQLMTLVRSRFGENVWVEDFFNDPPVVLFERNSNIYKLPYSIEMDVVSLSQDLPELVTRQKQYRTASGMIVGATTNSKGDEMNKPQLIAAIKQHGTRLTDAQLEAMDESILSNLLPAAQSSKETPATETEDQPATQNTSGSWEAVLSAAPADLREFLTDSVSRAQADRNRYIAGITQNSDVTAEELRGVKISTLEKMHISIAKQKSAPVTQNSTDPFATYLGATGTSPAASGSTNNSGNPVKPLLSPEWV